MSEPLSSMSSSVYRISSLRGNENYNVWCIQMEDVLTDLELYSYATGTEPIPEDTTITLAVKDKDGNDIPGQTTSTVTPIPISLFGLRKTERRYRKYAYELTDTYSPIFKGARHLRRHGRSWQIHSKSKERSD